MEDAAAMLVDLADVTGLELAFHEGAQVLGDAARGRDLQEHRGGEKAEHDLLFVESPR